MSVGKLIRAALRPLFFSNIAEIQIDLFFKNEQVFMSQKQKIKFNAVGFPISGCFAIVLLFDYYLFCFEAGKFKDAHCFEGKWLYLYPTSVKHFDRTAFGIFAQSVDLL